MDVKRFVFGTVAACAAVASVAATPLNDIPGTTEIYSAAETDAAITAATAATTNYTDKVLADFAATGTVARANVYGTPTRWTDATGCVWEVVADIHAPWNEDITGSKFVWDSDEEYWTHDYTDELRDFLFFVRGENLWKLYSNRLAGVFYCVGSENDTRITVTNDYDSVRFSRSIVSTNLVGLLALTNDIPHAVTVVAPSPYAADGTAADAKATGTAIYTGFTEWICEPPTYNGRDVEVKPFNSQLLMKFWRLQYVSDGGVIAAIPQSLDDVRLELYFEDVGVTATRHLITPTKTSQVQNDGDGNSRFATLLELAAVGVDATNYTDAVAAEFEDGTRTVQSAMTAGGASTAGVADYLAVPGDFYSQYTATDLMREATNAALSVADAKISTNNPALVSAIKEVAPPTADYSSVSNAAMNARSKTDLNVYADGLTQPIGGIVTTNAAGGVLIAGTFAQGTNVTASGAYSHAEGVRSTANGRASHAEGINTRAGGEASHASGIRVFSTEAATFAAGINVNATNSLAFAWSGKEETPYYGTHGKGTFNVNPTGGIAGMWVGNDALLSIIYASLTSDEPHTATIEFDEAENSSVTTNFPPLREAVVRTIREHSLGGIWDSQLEVWWTPIMENGALRYVATTNVNLSAEGN